MNNRLKTYLDELYPNPKASLKYQYDYQFLIAVMLSAQTTDVRVNRVTNTLFKYSLEELKDMDVKDIENIIKSIGTYHKKALNVKEIARRIIEDKPDLKDRQYLETLPGVGRKTINVFLSEIYNIPAIGVDTHITRITKRLNIVKEKDNVLLIEKKLEKIFPKEKWGLAHKQLIYFGRNICSAYHPKCSECKLSYLCKYHKKNTSNK